MRYLRLLLLVSASLALALPAGAALRVGRLKYGGGGDWYANPSSVPNLLKFAREQTTLDLPEQPDVVTLADDKLMDYALLFATGHGRIAFTAAEAARLRRYLLSGGFLHVDDNYGLDETLRPALKAVFPDQALTEIPFSHPLYHGVFDFPQGLPKIHEHHGGPPHGYGIIHENRVVLFYSYNTDLSDGWESPEVHNDPPDRRLAALRMGLNLVVYALTH
ncbi:DUF4159 domain-containing protein [bacterium]|nr:DUF4159 domain-containing protein [bacterium]